MNESYAALVARLRRSNYASLEHYIDWQAMPERSLSRAYGFIFLFAMGTAAFFVIWIFLTAVTWATVEVIMSLPSKSDTDAKTLIGILLGVVGPFIGFCLFVFSGRLLATRLSRLCWREISRFPELSLFSSAKPTVYLRRFAGENSQLPAAELQSPDPRISLGARVDQRFGVGDRSLEKALAEAVHSIGPLICLSDPGGRQVYGEARRIAVRSEVWQEAVSSLLMNANLVVMEFNGGDSLNWEANRVIHSTRSPFLLWIPNPTAIDLPKWLESIMTLETAKPAPPTHGKFGVLLLLSADRSTVWVARPQLNYTEFRDQARHIIWKAGLPMIRQEQTIRRPISHAFAAFCVWMAPWFGVALVAAIMLQWIVTGESLLGRAALRVFELARSFGLELISAPG